MLLSFPNKSGRNLIILTDNVEFKVVMIVSSLLPMHFFLSLFFNQVSNFYQKVRVIKVKKAFSTYSSIGRSICTFCSRRTLQKRTAFKRMQRGGTMAKNNGPILSTRRKYTQIWDENIPMK